MGSGLTDRSETPRRPHLVFTSAGPDAGIDSWLTGSPEFDLWIVDYGGCDPRLLARATYTHPSPGAKFPNLHRAWSRWPELFERYEAILVLDDDLDLRAADINHLFACRAEHDLWILQPSYDPRGKIAHAVTRSRPLNRIRFANFVEVGCPLFRRDKLAEFLAVYDPALVGYGVDWWFCEVIGAGATDRIAIVDEVACLNPLDREKGGRSIDRVESRDRRRAVWKAVKADRGLVGEEAGYHVYGRVPAPRSLTVFGRAALLNLLWVRRRMIDRLSRQARRGIRLARRLLTPPPTP